MFRLLCVMVIFLMCILFFKTTVPVRLLITTLAIESCLISRRSTKAMN